MLIGRVENERIALSIGHETFGKSKARILRITYKGFLVNLPPANTEVLVTEILSRLRRGESDFGVVSHERYRQR